MPYIGHSIYTTYTRERVREAQGRLSRARGGAFSTCSMSSLHTIHVAARHSDYLCTAKEKNQRQAKNIATQNNRQESQHSMSSGLPSGFFPISGHQQKVECGYGKNDDDIMIWWRHNDSCVCLWLRPWMTNYECMYTGVKLNYKKLKQRETDMRRHAKVCASSVSSILISASAWWPREWSSEGVKQSRRSLAPGRRRRRYLIHMGLEGGFCGAKDAEKKIWPQIFFVYYYLW